MKKWKVKFYLTEVAFRNGSAVCTETTTAPTREAVVVWAKNYIKNTQFKFYEIIEL